jgi:hypothetical protein
VGQRRAKAGGVWAVFDPEEEKNLTPSPFPLGKGRLVCGKWKGLTDKEAQPWWLGCDTKSLRMSFQRTGRSLGWLRHPGWSGSSVKRSPQDVGYQGSRHFDAHVYRTARILKA